MAFSVLAGIGVLFLFALLLVVGITPLLAVPVAIVLGGVAVVAWSAAGRMRHGRVASGAAPSGVPSTRDASYTPQQQP